MNALALTLPKKHFTFIIQNLVSVFVVLFLFYIDEGCFDFRWMLDVKNWFWFVVYVGLFSTGQMICKVYLFKSEYNLLKSIAIGITGVLINIGIIMLLGLIGYLFS